MKLNQKKLDILIPAYNCLEFIIRIEKLTKFITTGKINIIVSDDSTKKEISNEIRRFCEKNNIHYTIGPKTKNAVDNWNRLLGYTISNYYILLHHDEMFETVDDINQILDYISKFRPDAFVSSLLIKSSKGTRRFSNNYFKKIILEKFPNYLYIRNCIGSPSNIIFHNRFSIYKYQNKLKWLVDTNYFCEIFNKKKYYVIYGIFNIVSFENTSSITNNLNTRSIAKEERKVLKIRYKIPYLMLDLFWIFLK